MMAQPVSAVHLEIGQRYACLSAHPTRKLEVLVGRIDDVPGARIVSVQIRDAAPSTTAPLIQHAPFSEEVLAASCPKLLAANVTLPATFTEGYGQWRAATGGGSYFTITADAALDAAIAMMERPR